MKVINRNKPNIKLNTTDNNSALYLIVRGFFIPNNPKSKQNKENI